MPRRLPPFVERWRDRHGKVRVYFRRGRGARIALPGSIGSEEFTAAYQAAISGTLAPSREGRVRNAPGTIGALVVSYMKSANYIGLRETTKKGYASRIEALADEPWSSDGRRPHARSDHHAGSCSPMPTDRARRYRY